MKKLNRKGFTLVELLAVIVILAIVVGITMVTVLPTLKKSRQETFEISAQTAADTIEKYYQLYVIGETETIPTDLMTDFAATGVFDKNNGVDVDKALIELSGLKPANYIGGKWYITQSTGRVCVELIASTNKSKAAGVTNLAGAAEAGEYYDATENGTEVPINAGTDAEVRYTQSYALSSGCSGARPSSSSSTSE